MRMVREDTDDRVMHETVRTVCAVFGFSFLLSLPLVSLGQAGELDFCFGRAGRVTTDFAGDEDVARAMSVQGDGKIVVAGVSRVADLDFALARYLPDGSLDESFGNGGLVTTDFAGKQDEAEAIALQADGKIVVAGRSLGGDAGGDFAVARYLPNGSLDSAFGNGGWVSTDFYGRNDEAHAVLLQDDDKIVVAGSAKMPLNVDYALARYHSNGSLDASFGDGGRVTTDFKGVGDFGNSTVLQSDGKIIVAGVSKSLSGSIGRILSMARYHPDGSLDESFGGQSVNLPGRASVVTLSYSLGAESVILQDDGKIVTAGLIFDRRDHICSPDSPEDCTAEDFALFRFLPDGSLDTEFGAGATGIVATDFAGAIDLARSATLQSDGKIVAAGSTKESEFADGDFALARYLPDGSLDESFGGGGMVTTDFSGANDEAFATALQGDGKVVVAGNTVDLINGLDFALARYVAQSIPAETVSCIAGEIGDLVESGSISNHQAYGLPAILKAAIKQLDKGHEHSAAILLQAFIKRVDALVNAGKLADSDAQLLIGAAGDVINELH